MLPRKPPALRLKLLADYGVYLLVRLLICAVQSLSLETCQSLAKRVGGFCWRVLKLRRKVTEENLMLAFPEKTQEERDAIALAMWEHILLMVMEIAHAPRKVKRTTWRQFSSIPSMKEMLVRQIDKRPTVIISGHLGNFEMGGYLLALHGFPTHTVARPLDNVFLDRFVNDFRGSTGQYMLSKHGSGEQIAEVLNQGGTLALLGDQHAGSGACWVDFFGKPASTHKAVAVFTLGSLAPTAVSAALRRSGKPLVIDMKVADIVDPKDADFQYGTIPLLTEWYTRHLEALIRTAPEQYWWVHRRWKGEPVSRKTRRMQKQQVT